MTNTIILGGVPVLLCGNAATPLRYKQVFQSEMLQDLQSVKTSGNLDPVKQLAFIMARQAEKADFSTVSPDGYIDWLEGIEEDEIMTATGTIMQTWINTAKTSSTPKKKKG